MPVREIRRFFCYRQSLWLSVHAVCDYKDSFMDVECRWPGGVRDGKFFANSSIHAKLRSNRLPSTFQTPVPGSVTKNLITSLVIQHIHCSLSAWKTMIHVPAMNKSFSTTCCVLPETRSNVLLGDLRQDGPYSLQKWTLNLRLSQQLFMHVLCYTVIVKNVMCTLFRIWSGLKLNWWRLVYKHSWSNLLLWCGRRNCCQENPHRVSIATELVLQSLWLRTQTLTYWLLYLI